MSDVSEYYNPHKTRNLYNPASDGPHTLSRVKVELFVQCPRCFWMDQRKGTGRPPSMPFNLNSAVDELLKREFDAHRSAGTPHPLMTAYGIDAVPYSHPSMDEWREALRGGVRFHHTPTNLVVRGAPDDIWINRIPRLHVVDYKATAKDGEVSLDAPWQDGYKRQVSFYGWLLDRNGFPVDATAYFVYCNGRKDAPAFDGKLEFSVKVIPHTMDMSWVEPTLHALKACLDAPSMPDAAPSCDWCAYRTAAHGHEHPGGSGRLDI